MELCKRLREMRKTEISIHYILYRSVMLYCISNCTHSVSAISVYRQYALIICYMLRPFHHHQVCTFTVGCIAYPLDWPMFTAGVYFV
jgi:hypothetical protein